MDETIARGGIPRTLPFVRRETVNALKVAYLTQEAADEGISRALRNFYQSQFPQAGASNVETVVRAADAIYRRNVFPEMNVTFGTYRTELGHIDFPGCFRCHDDSHTSKDGTKISQDCDSCHKIE